MEGVPLKSDTVRPLDAGALRDARDDRDGPAAVEVALAREMRVSKALRDVGVALGTTLDLDELLELILQKITEALEADRTTLYLLDEANDELVSRVAQGEDVRSIRLKMGRGIAGHVARTGKPLAVQAAYEDPRFSAEWDMVSGYRTRSILAAPMKNHLGKTIGVVQVLNKKRGEFTEDDADILAALATQAAVSIDNSRLFMSVTQKNIQLLDTKEQLEHRVRDLKLLFELEHAMSRAVSLEELFMAVLGEAMRACEAKMGAVALRDPEDGSGTLYLIDERAKKMKRVPYPENVGLIGWAIRNNEVLISSDAESDSRRDRALDDRVGGATARTALAAPFEGEHNAPIGAIAIYNKRRGRAFSEEDRGLVDAHRGERVDGHPAPAVARGARARGAPDDHRPPALGRHPRSQDAAHRHQRLRADDAVLQRGLRARKVRAADPQAVRSHRRDAARGARVRARREERPGAQGVRAEILRRRASPARGRSRRGGGSSSSSTCRSGARRASTRARCSASSTTSRATRPRPWSRGAASS